MGQNRLLEPFCCVVCHLRGAEEEEPVVLLGQLALGAGVRAPAARALEALPLRAPPGGFYQSPLEFPRNLVTSSDCDHSVGNLTNCFKHDRKLPECFYF